MTGPRLSYEDFQQDLSPDAFGRETPRSPLQKALSTPEGRARFDRQTQDEYLNEDMPTLAEKAGDVVGGNLANLIRDVPGGEALTAGAHALIHRQPYSESLQAVRASENATPGLLRAPERLAGGLAATMALPGSAAMQGARYGALRGLAQADPDADLGERVRDAVLEGTVGAAGGKAGELIGTGIGALRAPSRGVLEQGARKVADAAEPLYDEFRSLGDLGMTPKLQKILSLPMVKSALTVVKGESPELVDLPVTDARVLDALYKKVGNKAFAATQGYGPGQARQSLLAAIDEAASAKGGSYVAPVAQFKKGMGLLDATQMGRKAVNAAISPSGGGENAVTPEALADWAADAPLSRRNAAANSILSQTAKRGLLARAGGLKMNVPVPFPSKALRAAPGLLNAVGRQPSNFQEVLQALMASGLPPQP